MRATIVSGARDLPSDRRAQVSTLAASPLYSHSPVIYSRRLGCSEVCTPSEAWPTVAEQMFDESSSCPWLEELNAEQTSAATYSGDTLLILAGAGTGKTTTLCARVACLLGAGVPAEGILLLTFTRRAA